METRANEEFCPLAKAKSHCNKSEKSKTDDSAILLEQSDNKKYDCCGFLPAVFDKARKIEKNPQAANVTSKVKVERPQFSGVVNDFEIAAVYHSPNKNREKLFIKNCVFRI